MSTKDTAPDIKNVVENTNILAIISQILSLNDALNDKVRYLKVSAKLIFKQFSWRQLGSSQT